MPIDFEIINTNSTPPGGWEYKQPESGRVFKHYSYEAWTNAIREHRLGNGYLMTADWQLELQDQLCKKNPNLFPGTCRRVNMLGRKRRFSFGATMSFLGMLWKWLRDGRPMVEQEEAERRAAICVTCPYNQPLQHSCGACFSSMLKWISKIVGDRKTENDDKLGSCGICSCSLKPAVHFPLAAQQDNLSEDIKNDFRQIEYCWKRENL